ncbi:MaoC family dehydratase N-terminal domain-containing protein [Candidatus Bathyarchaeota archaeon]|nr:MaoC family dehydratase N-terminal domain-containing protein [Candidatus Bathyarchaeota archaeon]
MTVKLKTVEECWEDSKKLLGLPITTPGGNPVEHQARLKELDFNTITKFSYALGDDNPLYLDQSYARKTRWGTMLAHPVILNHVRYTVWRGAIAHGDYPVSTLVAGWALELNDVARIGDSFKSSFIAKDVLEKKGRAGSLLFTYSHAGYWNQYNELVGTGRGGNCLIGKQEAAESVAKGEGVRTSMIYERGTYHYSKDEVEKIVAGIEGEKRRGASPLYWEDVKVGDKLTPIVKGPLTTEDLMNFHAAAYKPSDYSSHEIAFRKACREGGVTNPATGWPYESMLYEHYDWNLCRGRGLPAPFDIGYFRGDAVDHLLSNWMGDDGFVRRIEVQFRKPNYYGDTTWYNGELVRKYKDKIGDEEYGAVDIKIVCTNQIDEVTLPGTATVYLPSPDKQVRVPIPHDDKYKEYEDYIKKCEELRAHHRTEHTWPIKS